MAPPQGLKVVHSDI